MTSCPVSRRLFTTFVPISPLPPMTTIFMTRLLGCRPRVAGGCTGEFTRPQLVLLRLRDGDLLRVPRVQHDCDEPGARAEPDSRSFLGSRERFTDSRPAPFLGGAGG